MMFVILLYIYIIIGCDETNNFSDSETIIIGCDETNNFSDSETINIDREY